MFEYEQPWPSGNEFDSDQHGPGFEAHSRPLVTSGRASSPKCSQNKKVENIEAQQNIRLYLKEEFMHRISIPKCYM